MVSMELRHHGIIGQKWGVRRYQNKDGTLTNDGQKRYERDKLENAGKKKDNRIDVSQPDPNRWVKEDLTRQQNVVNTTSKLVDEFGKIEKETRPKVATTKMDLSKMSDKEMRERINRELLEQQYNKLFSEVSPADVSKGRKYTQAVLETAGTVLTLTSSALAIALSIKELKG